MRYLVVLKNKSWFHTNFEVCNAPCYIGRDSTVFERRDFIHVLARRELTGPIGPISIREDEISYVMERSEEEQANG